MRTGYPTESMSHLPNVHNDSPSRIAPVNHSWVGGHRAAATKAVAALALLMTAQVPAAFATPSILLDPDDPPLATCAACHGASGEGSSAGAIPRLAGQDADYLAHAL